MNKGIYFGFAVLNSACSPPPQPPLTTDENAQNAILINTSGLTCYKSSCPEITRGSVRVVGFKIARILKGIGVSDGTVTMEEFQ